MIVGIPSYYFSTPIQLNKNLVKINYNNNLTGNYYFWPGLVLIIKNTI
jgi:hypothetical protein